MLIDSDELKAYYAIEQLPEETQAFALCVDEYVEHLQAERDQINRDYEERMALEQRVLGRTDIACGGKED